MSAWTCIVAHFYTIPKKWLITQVATTLLVAGYTLTFCIPWQTPFASTSLYSSIAQSTGFSCNCRWLTCGLFQLTHTSRDQHAVQLINFEQALVAKTKTKHCHKGEFRHVSDRGQNLCGPFWEQHRRWQLYCAFERWRTTGRQRDHNSTKRSLRCGLNLRGPFLGATLPCHGRQRGDKGVKTPAQLRLCHCVMMILTV